MKLGVPMFGQFVKHDAFPAVVATIAFVSSTVAVIALVPTQGLKALGVVTAVMVSSMGAYLKAVKTRDCMRKKDLPAATPPEALPPTDVGGLPK